MSQSPIPKTEQIPVTPVFPPSLTDLSLEPLLNACLNNPSADLVMREWNQLPLSEQRYVVGKRLAGGGMGTIYTAQDKVLDRIVAIKVLSGQTAEDPSAVVRFLQEARIHAQLHHPGIPPLHDVGRFADGRPFLAMKFISGRTLAAHLANRFDPPDWDGYRAMFEQVCRTVAYAHTKGVIHRDLTPGNVLVAGRGRVQVIDWGLAKVLTSPVSHPDGDTAQISVINLSHTDEGVALGTPAFMAPEVMSDGAATATEQSDVFGLGAVLCFILTGIAPFEGPAAVPRRPASEDLKEAYTRLDECGGPPDLVALAKVCLSPDLTTRPRSANEVLLGITKPPPSVKRRRSWWSRLFNRKD